MLESDFKTRKENLLSLISDKLEDSSLVGFKRESVLKTEELLNRYNFGNRLKLKGLLSRVIIDSLEVEAPLGEQLIEFDQTIS